MTTSPWQDQPLPMSGTYDYTVFAATPTGSIVGQTQFDFAQAGGGTTTPPPAFTPVTPILATPPPGTITPMAPTGAPAVGTSAAPAPRVGGTTAVAPLGPATVTTTDRQGWGAIIEWAEVVNATGYQLDRLEPGGAWMMLTGIDAKAQPAVAGLHRTEDVTVVPGIRYEYRVMALFSSGPVSGYGPIATYDASPAIAQVSNLQVSQIHAPVQGKSLVQWQWTTVPTVLTYEVEVEVLESIAPHASVWKSRLSVFAQDSPPFQGHVDSGRRVKFCVSLVRPISPIHPPPYAVCTTEDIP
jgi:hypothetical protein